MEICSNMKLDETDIKILKILKENAKLRVREISKLIRKPITTVHNRIKKLTKEKVIKKYTVEFDDKKMGKDVDSFVLVAVNYGSLSKDNKTQEDLAKEIKKLSAVEEVVIVAGIKDIIIRVKEKDIECLNDFLINKLRKIKGVSKTQTVIILKKIE